MTVFLLVVMGLMLNFILGGVCVIGIDVVSPGFLDWFTEDFHPNRTAVSITKIVVLELWPLLLLCLVVVKCKR